VTTLRRQVEGRDQESFVGRAKELAVFDRVLDGNSPTRLIHLLGIGGIGKSALLREVVRRARRRGFDTVWLDGRDLPPFPAEVDAAIDAVTEAAPALVVFDSYELISSLDSYLRESVVPDLPDTTVVVFASRQPPSRAWFEHGWDRVVETIELDGLPSRDATDLLRVHGLASEEAVDEIVRRSHGSPLALVVGAEAGVGASLGDLADRLLGDEVDPDRYRILSVAALARVTTPELLDDVLGDADPHESYKWLASVTFSEPLTAGVTLHSLVAHAVRDRIRSLDPAGEAALRRRIADHLYRRAVAGHFGLSVDLQHLVVDPGVKWGFASDVGNRYRIDRIQTGDTDHIGAVLDAVGVGDWWQTTKVFFTQHPEFCGVARDASGGIGGYFVAVAPASAPPAAHDDPLLGPWLRYARDELNTTSAVLWREAVDLTGEMGEVTSLLGAGGLLSTGISNPRYGFLPISPLIPAAKQFSDALGAVHVPELDLRAAGQELDCYVVDFGPGGLLGFQRDWIYRESGMAAAPLDAPDDDPARLLRMLREPGALAHGPAWLGATPAERLANLRRRVLAALDVFGPGRDDQLARTIVEHAFLGDGSPHEAIARQLHLSRSAYFRRLNAATSRVGEQVLAAARRG
jgi:hypothetical protein